ncbi:F-box protein At4g22280-like [Quercus lobata]|uniref:F-box domain-containing protein n=1 Tax=Quercus lobata TaxID=97700 RepID=A0A7N2R8X4_QUELO|nr:F-box protein At4g22280-like [Quercus lobata]
MAESKTKSQKLFPKNDTLVDRISDLPESLICHILSFLPIQEALATSILSSRWEHLWTLVSRLDLDSETIGDSLSCGQSPNQGQCKPFSFGHIVSKLLTLHTAPYLRTFRLKFFLCRNCSRLDKWIGNVVERKLEELDLEIYADDSIWKLPQSIFSCKTLVVLNLNGTIVLDPPPSFQFPSLKILRLVHIVYRPDSVFRLLSGCPVLEDLSFQREDLEGVFKHKICASTLKRLSITFGQSEFDGSYFGSLDYKLEINAPALEYFKFDGHLRDIVFLHKLDSLVQADVYISSFEARTFWVDWEDDRHRDECCADRVFNFLAALYNVKLLSFSSSSLKCLSYGSACLSQFQNLVQLDFKVNAWTWHMLQALLQNAPNLEVLFVTHKSHGYLKHKVCWKERPDDPNNLTSCLTSFWYKGFGFKHELEFVKYILKEARVLKKATIHVRDGKLKGSIVKKISRFPRCSMTCLLTVN